MIALLYDVHGNLPALDAVLADAREAGAAGWVVGGDVALFGAYPEETVARLRSLHNARWLRGNGERWTAAPDDAPEAVQGAISRCRELLGEDIVAELARLPETHADGETLYCHGSPQSDVQSFLPEPADDEPELLAGLPTGVRRLVFGHTHLAFRRQTAQGIELVNPGSVGMPWDGDHDAAYAILHDDGRVELRRVEYDWRAYAAAVRERVGELPAKRIEQARFDVG